MQLDIKRHQTELPASSPEGLEESAVLVKRCFPLANLELKYVYFTIMK